MKTNILFPTDFSDNAWCAAVYALHLYKETECKFYFLHSTKMTESTMSNFSNKLLKIMSDNALKELNDLKSMAESADANANHEFEIILSQEDLHNAIENTIDNNNIDIVVIGTKGAAGAKGFLFGSHTVRIIKKIKNCSILIVPEEFDFVEPTQIAFPTDFHRFYGEEILAIKCLTELYNSKIRILHINEEDKLTDLQEYNLEMLKTALKNYTYSFHWMPDYANKTEEINDFIEYLDINILVMINYKQSLIEKIIKEPVIKKIGFKPLVPVLIIPCII
ncbi:nucleotide-binding universal stress UspA family protein [Winogradskyella pacifica]|uniref:Nucleotide-binding universal stress UspA family protein n=1 Tax=Winogradskyella pacifica TaxID=664642 RepID=A0A3D9LM63_9FLAO|nr:universal stress protein [Winogradskyella pacifica]REE07736.1 nucleotide-binding universal stress UspA family protein [Winogradskyella pacifica]